MDFAGALKVTNSRSLVAIGMYLYNTYLVHSDQKVAHLTLSPLQTYPILIPSNLSQKNVCSAKGVKGFQRTRDRSFVGYYNQRRQSEVVTVQVSCEHTEKHAGIAK